MITFKLIRKAYMTLLETLIAVSLLSMLLVFAFGFFRELSQLTHLSEQEQKKSFQTRYLESRLNYLFERIVNENATARHFFFYTEPPIRNHSMTISLILTFDNDVRLNPEFSGDVLGKLYIDPEFQLRLATWPLHVEEPHLHMQEEVLFENVANVRYEFYAAPERINNTKDITTGTKIDPDKKLPEKDKWHENEWPVTYEQMPSIMRLTIDVANNPKDLESYHPGNSIKSTPKTFYFVLPSSKNPVHYPPFQEEVSS